MSKKGFIIFHMFNNFSGSPNVLSTIINSLLKYNYEITLVSSFNNKGFLSYLNGINKVNLAYSYHENYFMRAVQFFIFQIKASIVLFKYPKEMIVYINTIYPFLPAILAKIRNQSVIYHIHEGYPKRGILTGLLFQIAQLSSKKIICVSKCVQEQIAKKYRHKTYILNNVLSSSFCERIKPDYSGDLELKRKTILMVSSAKKYKGIFMFIKLANILNEYRFILILDISEKDKIRLFSKYNDIPNLTILSRRANLHPYYNSSGLIVNLSDPEKILETFGLSVLEGMSYGLPAVVPNVGGISELVDDGIDGYHANVNNIDQLVKCIKNILDNQEKYEKMSYNARMKARRFDLGVMTENLYKIIGDL